MQDRRQQPESKGAPTNLTGGPEERITAPLAPATGSALKARFVKDRSRPLDSNILDFYSAMMEFGFSEADARLAVRLRGLRVERGLTLDGLAGRAGVSRSMISLIERGESSPTASVLHRLATGLGTTLASLFDEEERPEASPVARRGDQPAWRDPETNYLRRNLSPSGFPSPIELVEVILPPGARVTYDGVPRSVGIDQQIWVLEGAVELTAGTDDHCLAEGDCLAMRVDRPTAFRNPTARPTRYVVALTTTRARANSDGETQR